MMKFTIYQRDNGVAIFLAMRYVCPFFSTKKPKTTILGFGFNHFSWIAVSGSIRQKSCPHL